MWQSADPIDRFHPQSPTIGLNLYQYGLLNPIRYNDPTGLSEEEGIFAKIERKFEEAKSSIADAMVKPFREAVKERQESFSRRAGDDPETAEQSATEHADAAAGRSREEAKKMIDSAAEGATAILITKGLGGAGSGLKFGGHKTDAKWLSQMEKRGWTENQIAEAVDRGQRFPAENLVNKGNSATRYVHPETGRSVVVDNVTKEIIHVGGDGFKY